MNLKSVIRLIGLILVMLGASMLLPVAVSVYFRENAVTGLLLASVLVMTSGGLLYLLTRKTEELSNRDGFGVVTFGWLCVSLAGALPYLLTGSIPNLTDAFFESVSGFTTTGATILVNIEAHSHGILLWRSFTQWVGGMGIIVFSIAILPFLGVGGMQMFKAESPGLKTDKITPRIRQTAEILWVIYLLITLIEVILLRLGGMGWFDAACHSLTTMSTGGFSTKNASIAYYQSDYIHYVITLFMFIAAVSFTLHTYALRGQVKRYWSSPEFRFFSILTALFILIITVERLISGDPLSIAFRDSAFQVVAIVTTTGYATADYELWHFSVQGLLVILMLMGGMAGSTAGGIKAVRVQILLKQARIELHKLVHPNTLYPIRLGRKVIQHDIVQNVLAFFLLYVLLMIFGTLAMALLGLDHVTSLTSVISALSNVGPALGATGPTDNYSAIPFAGKWLLALLMLIGRLEIFTVLVLLTRTYWSR